jgi:hypothetical protein
MFLAGISFFMPEIPDNPEKNLGMQKTQKHSGMTFCNTR